MSYSGDETEPPGRGGEGEERSPLQIPPRVRPGREFRSIGIPRPIPILLSARDGRLKHHPLLHRRSEGRVPVSRLRRRQRLSPSETLRGKEKWKEKNCCLEGAAIMLWGSKYGDLGCDAILGQAAVRMQ